MKRGRGNFRGVCHDAKTRLGKGFWNMAREEREQQIKSAESKGKSGGEVLNSFIKKFKQTERCAEEELLYRNICGALERHPHDNPLSVVLDREYMKTLSSTESERYVLDLSAKVRSCIERFHNERTLSS